MYLIRNYVPYDEVKNEARPPIYRKDFVSSSAEQTGSTL